MKTMILVVSAILVSWAGTAHAADLLGTSPQVKLSLSSPFADTPRFTPQLLEPGDMLALGMPDGAARTLLGQGASMDSGTRSIIALLLTIFIGFGTGHFVIGDGAAVLFLGLEVGLVAAVIVIYAAAFAAAAGGVLPVFIFLAPIALLGYAGVRIWELVDCIFKSGIVGGGSRSAAILPTGPELTRGFAFQPMAANGPVWRF